MITLYLSNKIAAFFYLLHNDNKTKQLKKNLKKEHQQKNKQNCFFPCQIYSSKQLKF